MNLDEMAAEVRDNLRPYGIQDNHAVRELLDQRDRLKALLAETSAVLRSQGHSGEYDLAPELPCVGCRLVKSADSELAK